MVLSVLFSPLIIATILYASSTSVEYWADIFMALLCTQDFNPKL